MNHLKPLQKELLIFIVCLLLAAVVVFLSYTTLQTARENRATQQQTLNAAKNRYYLAVKRKALLDEFSLRYAKLPQKNIVGDENRLSWVDTIETIAEQLPLPYLKYRIEKREPLDDNALKKSFPGIDVFYSSMSLEMQLLHEGDLYRLLDQLQNKANGLFDVQRCSMHKNNAVGSSVLESRTSKNFSSVCVLNWYTLQAAAKRQPDAKGRRR
ncbi:MAG TPA: hypothetical protein VIQ81_01270 [Gammaproteobacteria bacterium]